MMMDGKQEELDRLAAQAVELNDQLSEHVEAALKDVRLETVSSQIGQALEATQRVREEMAKVTKQAQPLLDSLERTRAQMQPVFDRLNEATERARSQLQPIFDEMRRRAEPMRQLAAEGRRGQTIYEAGWLPHVLVPASLGEGDDPADVSAKVEQWATETWPDIRAALSESFDIANPGGDSRATIEQALDAHEQGLYRLVPPAAFMVIERAYRVRFVGPDEHGSYASMQEVRDGLGGLTSWELGYGVANWPLVHTLLTHTYARTQLAGRLRDYPNRHATMHGIVAYGTRRDSLNALFLADAMFVLFQTLSAD